MNLVIILVSNPNRMMLNPNVMSLLQVINFIVILLVFFGIYWGFLNKFLFFLLLQLSKIESGCLLNQFLMWFKDYEKLQHLLLSTQTLNRKSACFLLLRVFFPFETYYYLFFVMRNLNFDTIFIYFFSVLRTFTTLQPSSMLKLSSTNTNDDSSSKPIVVDYFDFDG